ncbi:iron chaperone [Gulosibacter massiliensis]|uniref:iron chaperone n=1 Tax=Gulosibacter massiliensis TaxID=2479839 RepID=UPI000F631D4C|nr:hypothetical protein [Gulosibacter massiliensis]
MAGFTKAEREAMQERAEELRAEKGGKTKAKNLEALLETIEELPAGDRAIAVALHQVVTEVAPHLDGRTWYGMPAYELDGDVVLFLQVTSKFDTRYSTLGFNQDARLDDGEMWPTHFAIPKLTDDVVKRMRTLVRTAVGD